MFVDRGRGLTRRSGGWVMSVRRKHRMGTMERGNEEEEEAFLSRIIRCRDRLVPVIILQLAALEVRVGGSA